MKDGKTCLITVCLSGTVFLHLLQPLYIPNFQFTFNFFFLNGAQMFWSCLFSRTVVTLNIGYALKCLKTADSGWSVRVAVNNDADPDYIRPANETCTALLLTQETFKPRKHSLPRVSGLCARHLLRAWSRQLTPGSAAAGLPLPHQTASSSWFSPVTLHPSKAPSLNMCGTDRTEETQPGYFVLRYIGAKQISCSESNSGVPQSSPG